MFLANTEAYGYVILAIALISIVQYGIGSGVMSYRKNFSKPEFLNKPAVKLLQEQHKKDFGAAINNNGYPDTGNGRYSEHLDYDQWVGFNNAQRAHNNMIEVSAPVLACLIVSGLFQPEVCAGMGFAFAVGRIIYAIGYLSKKGADGRLFGAVIGSLGTYGLYLITIYNGLRLAGILKQ